MTRFEVVCLLAVALLFLTVPASCQGEHENECSYSVLTNGPTWDSDWMRIPYDVAAAAWTRDGAYGGSGLSNGTGTHAGGTGVAVASVSYWFKVTHHALANCDAVTFDSQAKLDAEVSTRIEGAHDDYALATGFQAASGNALQATTLAVAATNAGSPVQNATISVVFGVVNFTLTIPGVSVTSDTRDKNRNSAFTWGSKKTEEELITVHAWTKIKVVSNGPFGGMAKASVDSTHASAKTTSTCSVHSQTGAFEYDASEG